MGHSGSKHSTPLISRQNGFDVFWFSEQFGNPVNQKKQQLCAPPSTWPAQAPTAENPDVAARASCTPGGMHPNTLVLGDFKPPRPPFISHINLFSSVLVKSSNNSAVLLMEAPPHPWIHAGPARKALHPLSEPKPGSPLLLRQTGFLLKSECLFLGQ